MLSNIFKSSTNSSAYIVFFLLLTVLKFNDFLPANITSTMPQDTGILLKPLFALNPYFLQGLSVILIAQQVVMLNEIYNDLRITDRENQIFTLTYFILLTLHPNMIQLGGAMVCNSIVVWILFDFIRKINAFHKNITAPFDLGIKIALCYFVFEPAAFLFPLMLLGLLLFREIKFTTILAFVMGNAITVYIIFSGFFLINKLHLATAYAANTLNFNLNFNLNIEPQLTRIQQAAWLITLLLLALGWLKLTLDNRAMRPHNKGIFRLIIVLCMSSIAVGFWYPQTKNIPVWSLAIPTATLLLAKCYASIKRKWLFEIIASTQIILAFITHYIK